MKTYKIVRFYQNESIPSKVIDTGLTLEEAKEHCKRESTHGPCCFDGFEEE